MHRPRYFRNDWSTARQRLVPTLAGLALILLPGSDRPAAATVGVPLPVASSVADTLPVLSDLAREVMAVTVEAYQGAPSLYLYDNRARLAWFDFGLPGQPTPEAIAVGENLRDEGFAWVGGMVRQKTRAGKGGPYLVDFMEGEDATFIIAVDPPDGDYRIVVTLGDSDQARGPVDVLVNDVTVASALQTEAGQAVNVGTEVVPENGRVSFRLRAHGCKSFAVAGAAVYGPKGAKFGRLFAAASLRSAVPPPRFAPDSRTRGRGAGSA